MDEKLKAEIINLVVEGKVSQTAAAKLYKISQPQISSIIKASGFISKLDEQGNLVYFQKEKEKDDLQKKDEDLLKVVNDKISIMQETLLQIIELQAPQKKNMTENIPLKLKQIYNKQVYNAVNENLNTQCVRRTFRIPKFVLDQLDDYILDNSEKYSVFISSLILYGIHNSNNPNNS